MKKNILGFAFMAIAIGGCSVVSAQIAQGPERDIDAITTREAGFDPDLWVIEIESRDGRTLLDQDGLA